MCARVTSLLFRSGGRGDPELPPLSLGGRSNYVFELVSGSSRDEPTSGKMIIKTPDATQEIVTASTWGDEPMRSGSFNRWCWSKAVTKAGLGDLRPHDLRATFVSRHVAAGAAVVNVQAHLGHQEVTTTLGYTRR
jgi:hypothetical protein